MEKKPSSLHFVLSRLCKSFRVGSSSALAIFAGDSAIFQCLPSEIASIVTSLPVSFVLIFKRALLSFVNSRDPLAFASTSFPWSFPFASQSEEQKEDAARFQMSGVLFRSLPSFAHM